MEGVTTGRIDREIDRFPCELYFWHDNVRYRAILLTHAPSGWTSNMTCAMCGRPLQNLAFYTTDPPLFYAHAACVLPYANSHLHRAAGGGSGRSDIPPLRNDVGHSDIFYNPYPPSPFPFYPGYGNPYPYNYYPANYGNHANIPNYGHYAQPWYPPPNFHHGHGSGAQPTGGTAAAGGILGTIGLSVLGAFLQALFSNMMS